LIEPRVDNSADTNTAKTYKLRNNFYTFSYIKRFVTEHILFDVRFHAFFPVFTKLDLKT